MDENGWHLFCPLTIKSAEASDGYIYKSGQCHPGLTYILNFWHSGTLALRDERQSARMSEIQNVG